jgi:Leucine-rich repeat (LRR) protein
MCGLQGNTPLLKICFDDFLIDVVEETNRLRNQFRASEQLSGERHSPANQSLLLKTIHLHRWISFTTEAEALRALVIEECDYLLFIPRSLGQLRQLKHLRIANCANLESFPSSIGSLANLKHLIIQDCKSLISPSRGAWGTEASTTTHNTGLQQFESSSGVPLAASMSRTTSDKGVPES